MKRFLSVAAVAALAVAPLAVSQSASADEGSTGERSFNIIQLGDSYSAGNGAGAYFGDPDARTSHNNYAELYSDWAATQPDVSVQYQTFAHSGAVTTDVLSTQIPQVPTDTDLVMFTIGGNDVGFQNIVQYCFAVYYRSASDCRDNVDAGVAALPTVQANTTQILQNLAARLQPGAEILLVGYPQLVEEDDYTLCDYVDFCWWGHEYDADGGVRDLATQAAAMQQQVVDAWNATDPANPATYISGVADAFTGHEFAPHTGTTNPFRWLNDFFETETLQGGPQEVTTSSSSFDKLNWFHPGITGHAQVAQVIEAQVGLTDRGVDIQQANASVTGPEPESIETVSLSAAAAAGPTAWVEGPYVDAPGSTILFDARGSVAGAGELTKVEWDFDGDGVFETVGGEHQSHRFDALFSGPVSVQVTQTDGSTAIASTQIQITADGDATEAGDNCPDSRNYSQSDEDGDGTGDACDPTPGHPTVDRPGVYVGAGDYTRVGDDPQDRNAPPINSAGTEVTLSAASAIRGSTIRVSATGFTPGDTARVGLVANGGPQVDATVAADGSVEATITVPATAADGDDRVVVGAPAALASAVVRIGSATTTAGSKTGTLAATGAEDPAAPIGLATLLLLAGGLTLVRVRRRAM